MSTVTALRAFASSGSPPYTVVSFTPVAGDLLVLFAVVSGSTAAGDVSDSLAGAWTKVTDTTKNGGADTLYCFVANQLSTGVAMTVTLGAAGGTGSFILIAGINPMTRLGNIAIRQSAKLANQLAATIPSCSFVSATLTGNPTMTFVANATNPTGVTTPLDWTGLFDTGYTPPTTGGTVASRDSGFTGTTITWGSTSPTDFGIIVVEFDTSAAAITTPEPEDDPVTILPGFTPDRTMVSIW